MVVRAAAACAGMGGRARVGEQAWVGDGACDRACLTAECRHDGHDCDGVLWEGAPPARRDGGAPPSAGTAAIAPASNSAA